MQGEPARAAEKAMQKERRGGGVLEREREADLGICVAIVIRRMIRRGMSKIIKKDIETSPLPGTNPGR